MKTLCIKYETLINKLDEDGNEIYDHMETIVKSFLMNDILTVVTTWDGLNITMIDGSEITTNSTTEIFFR